MVALMGFLEQHPLGAGSFKGFKDAKSHILASLKAVTVT